MLVTKILQHDCLPCFKYNPENSFGIYKTYATRFNIVSNVWITCIVFVISVWKITPIIIYVKSVTEGSATIYPKILPIAYLFDITNEYSYPAVMI